jgi:drug/metabolite transporter (DMT)-like permease
VTGSAAYLAVVASSVAHAYWNYLLKRAGGGQSVITLSKCAEVALLTPAFIAVGGVPTTILRVHWPLPVVAAGLVLANYLALARAYRCGNLAVVYPVSRGGILVFLPVIGLFALGERLSWVGVASIGLVTAGIAILPLEHASWSGARRAFASDNSAIPFALGAAASAALYTAWSKLSMASLPAFQYFYLYTALTAITLVAVAPRMIDRPLRDAWRQHWWPIVQVAALNSGAYLLVLLALAEGVSSYVIAIRQLSIVWSVVLARYALGEAVTRPQRIGIAVLITGCVLVTFA